MIPRPVDLDHDMPPLAALLGRTRVAGGIWLPGGMQWWLRELAAPRDDFEAFVWPAGSGDGFAAFVMRDGAFVVAESDGGPTRVELVQWAIERQRERGAAEIETSAAEGTELFEELSALGFAQKSTSLELMTDTDGEPPLPTLPVGFRFASLDEVDDDVYVEGHRAAWSDKRPSSYRRELHDAVRRMPQFRPDLATIALAPDGTVASYCMGWLDDQSRTLEIEPLGTHRDYRRLGLATAVVHEVSHRAWANGAQHVLVWNDPSTNPDAYGLYTGAGMTPRRRIAELSRTL